MDGVASVSSVGAVASNVQLQAAFQVQAVKKQQEVASGIGASALKLIQSAVINTPSSGHDLDVHV